MKKLLSISILVLNLISIPDVLTAQVSVDVSTDYVSEWNWRGLNFFNGNPAFLPAVTISRGTGFTFEIFGGFAAGDRDALAELDEIDLIAVYSIPLNMMFALDVGVASYTLIRNTDFPLGNATAFEPFVVLRAGSALNPSLSIYYNTNKSWGDGFYAEVGAAQPLPVSQKIHPEINAVIGYNGGSWGVRNAGVTHIDLGMTLPIKLGNGFGAHAGIYKMILLNNELKDINKDKGSGFWINLGFSVSF